MRWGLRVTANEEHLAAVIAPPAEIERLRALTWEAFQALRCGNPRFAEDLLARGLDHPVEPGVAALGEVEARALRAETELRGLRALFDQAQQIAWGAKGQGAVEHLKAITVIGRLSRRALLPRETKP